MQFPAKHTGVASASKIVSALALGWLDCWDAVMEL